MARGEGPLEYALLALAVWLLPTFGLALWVSRRDDPGGRLRLEVSRLRHELADLRALVQAGAPATPAPRPAETAPVPPPVAPAAAVALPAKPSTQADAANLASDVAEGLEQEGVLEGAPLSTLVDGLAEELQPPWAWPAAPAAPARPARPGRPLDELLAEHGLVWAGGVGLALGGLLTAAYAAQQGFFQPPVRIAAAWAVGLLMLVAGEAIRRGRSPAASHPQAAALTTAAGAATLYGAVWAAHALYSLIGLGVAGALLAGISVGLFGLAFLHGQTLAWLAIGGAYAAPMVVGAGSWPRTALGLYLLSVLATGAAAAGVHRWAPALGGAAAGALAWGLLGVADGDAISAVLFALAATAAVLAAAERWPDRAAAGLPQIAFAVVAAAAVVLAAGGGNADLGPDLLAPGAVGLLALAVWGMRRGLVANLAFAAACIGGSLGVVLVELGRDVAPWRADAVLLGVCAAAAVAAWTAAAALERRRLVVATGALTAFALAAWAGVYNEQQLPLTAWAGPLIASALLAGLGLAAARRNAPDTELDIWIGVASAALIVGVAQASTTLWAPAAYGAAAVGLALAHRRLGWRSWAGATAALGTVAVGALLTPDFVRTGVSEAPGPGAVALAAAVMLGAAARLLRPDARSIREAVQTMGVVAAIAGVVLQVRWWGSDRAELPIEPLLEAGLYGLSLSVSGLLALLRREPASGPIARWRGPALIGAGAAVSLAAGLVFSPWWGAADRASGAPVLNSLLVTYLAPAAVLLTASARSYAKAERGAARLYGVAGVLFFILWAMLELRRSFHGAGFGDLDEVSALEACAYALAALAAPFAVRAAVGRLPPTLAGAAEDVALIAERARIGVVLLSVVLLGVLFNPWWGWGEPMTGGVQPLLVLVGYAAAAVLCAAHARTLPSGRPHATAVVATAAQLFLLLTLAIRVAWHGAALRDGGAGDVETWSYSAVWALFGVALLTFSVWRREAALRWTALTVLFGAAAKVLVLDLAELDGLARAGSFLAVGALFIAGALLARRLTARGGAALPPAAQGA